MQSWATDELRYVQLGDARLNKRSMKIVGALSAHPESSVPQACGDWASTKATYEFWKNDKVKPDSINQAHKESTMSRLSCHDTVLNLQDTMDLNFTGHRKKQGMGHLDHVAAKGLKGPLPQKLYIRVLC